jgi:hypothetical protein
MIWQKGLNDWPETLFLGGGVTFDGLAPLCLSLGRRPLLFLLSKYPVHVVIRGTPITVSCEPK